MSQSRTLVLLIGLCACVGNEPELAVAEIDTLPGGVVRVTNRGPTEWSDTSGWRLVLERTVRPPAGTAGELISPRGIVATGDGGLFVLDTRPAQIKRFDATGRFVGVIAVEGSGPGEISAQAVLMISRDTLVVHDQSQTRTSVFLEDGSYRGQWSSQCCMMLPMQADTHGRFPVPGMLFTPTPGAGFMSGTGFERYHADGTVVDTIAIPYSTKRGDTWNAEGNIILVPMQPNDQARLTVDGQIIGGHQSEYTLRISGDGRDTLRLFTGIPNAVPIPDSIRQATFDRTMEAMPNLQPVARIDDLPQFFAPWSDFVTDGTGAIWVLVPGPRGEGDHWDVFSEEGVLLGMVPAPFDSIYRTYWSAERVYAIVDDEQTGLPEIRVYRIDRGN